MSEIPTLDALSSVGCIIVCIGESSMWWKMSRRRRTVIIHPELVQLISKQNMILSALNHPKEEEKPFLLMIYFQDFWNRMTTTTYPTVRWLRENPGFASYRDPCWRTCVPGSLSQWVNQTSKPFNPEISSCAEPWREPLMPWDDGNPFGQMM